MLAPMRWVLTRPLEDSRALAEELRLEVVPCIERHDLPWPPWPKSPLVFVTSVYVARRFTRLTAPPGTRVAALSPTTSAVLRRPDITAEGGAVALANAVKGWARPGTSILYPTSDQGLEQPEQEEAVRILEAVGTVHRHAVYQTRMPGGLGEDLRRYAGRDFVFFSPSAVTNFLSAKGEARRVVCVGASTARAWPGPAPLLATAEDVKKVLEENP